MATTIQSNQQIVNDIEAYIQRNGGPYRAWYVGIAKDARSRLFSDHGVREHGGTWIYAQAASSADARAIEQYFIEQRGTDGGPGGGDATTDMVYAYKKGPGTRP